MTITSDLMSRNNSVQLIQQRKPEVSDLDSLESAQRQG